MNIPIYVDGKRFLCRMEEQKRFRAALKEELHPRPGETLPYIFLLYSESITGGLIHAFTRQALPRCARRR